jgi:hypothetical protein
MDSMETKGPKHLANGCGPESLRAGRDVDFVVLILLLQGRRKDFSIVSGFFSIECTTQENSLREFVLYPAAKYTQVS